MTQHSHPAPIHLPVLWSSEHPYRAIALTTIVLLLAAVVAAVAIAVVSSASMTGLDAGPTSLTGPR